ncbi:MAG: 1,4-alpha-glucan branching enzyme [Alteromonadaceae bacterium]|nr:MAG: 1,4-alpha-glucan branching enzyme [Alteromonadaceae bacterium]
MDQISSDAIASIVNADCDDVFALLGKHQIDESNYAIRVFLPTAEKVEIIDYTNRQTLAQMSKLHDEGLFSAVLSLPMLDKYLFKVWYDGEPQIIEDAYRFPSTIGEQDLFLFGEGNHEKLYDLLGAQLCDIDGVSGVRFSMWAPNAKRVSVVGDFNFWDGRKHMMRKLIPSGVWELFIPGVTEGALYKFELMSRDGTLLPHKTDPLGFCAELRPAQASVVFRRNNYEWNDSSWLDNRHESAKREKPISIYEVHLGSWRRIVEEENRFLGYRELAVELVEYVKDMGFTHIQLMPVSEFPFDGSWGYQPVGLYAPTSRFGAPDDFKYFVDLCHQGGVSVLIDWVPGHFPTDAHGLGWFDGTPLYEHADSRQGFHPDWNTFIYNYGRNEVSNFLMANALFWFDEYHIDGLRVDAVASMLYLDYSREEGEWVPNIHGGRENLEAIDFIRKVNERVYKCFPSALMIAEESTSWPGVSKPTNYGGLGFGFKWNMGWMNDSLEYMKKEPVHRQYHHHDMTFSLYYAFSENFILPLSHDEVVHGKGSILDRMPGDGAQKFANLRAYYGFMWGHPGKKLLFMGCEFAQGVEWDHDQSLSWHQLEIGEHQGVKNLVKDLNGLYCSSPQMYENDTEESGFEWIEADDRHNSVFAFVRKQKSTGKFLIFVCNFTPVHRESYRIGVNKPGFYVERLNTDSKIYGGANSGNGGGVESQEFPWHYREHSIEITLPSLATLVFELQE